MSWQRYTATLLATGGGALALALAFVVLLNPYGNLTAALPVPHVIMDSNQRFQHPSIVRSGRFDSAVIGTSSSRLLAPADLDRAFGGRFANLAMDDGRAWEQVQLARLIVKEAPPPRTLLFALDWVWCAADADTARMTRRGFPDWLYDQSRFNDWLYLLNQRAVEISGRKAGWFLGLAAGNHPTDGYEIFVPPETAYDAERAAGNIWGGRERRIDVQSPAHLASADAALAWRMPAVAWLADLIHEVPAETRVLFAFMPSHVAAQPRPGSEAAAREAECKRRIAMIARGRGTNVVDFRIVSPLTETDTNYWDRLHYRLPIARRIVDGIAAAAPLAPGAEAGDWVVR